MQSKRSSVIETFDQTFPGTHRERRGHRKRFIAIVVAIVAVAAISWFEPAHGLIDRLIELVETEVNRHPLLGALFFVLLAALSAIIAFFSSAVVVPVGVVAWGEMTTFALLWTGWFLGGMTAYAIGRFLGRPVVKRLVNPVTMFRYERKISENAGFGSVLLFQLALPSEVPGYILGIMRFRLGIYLAALAVAELPFAIGAVWLGKSFLERDYLSMIAIGVAGVGFLFLALHEWHRRTGRR